MSLTFQFTDNVETDKDGTWVFGTYLDSSRVNFEEDLSDDEGLDEDEVEEWNNQGDVLQVACATWSLEGWKYRSVEVSCNQPQLLHCAYLQSRPGYFERR